MSECLRRLRPRDVFGLGGGGGIGRILAGDLSLDVVLRHLPFRAKSSGPVLVYFYRFSLPSCGQFSQFSPDFSQFSQV